MRPARRPALLCTAVLAGLGLVTSGCQQTAPYAAIVNGARISQDHLFRELRALKDNAAFVTQYDAGAQQNQRGPVLAVGTAKPTFTQSFVAVVLGSDVQAQVIHAEVLHRHVEPSAAAIAGAKLTAGEQFGADQANKPLFDGFSPWFQHLFEQRQAESDALRKALGTSPVDDTAVAQFYATMPQLFTTNQCVSQIVLKTKAQADALRAQLAAGADFATLARQQSTDPATAAKGGDLGCAPPGSLPTEVDQAAAALPAGQLSVPVAVQASFDVIKVTRRDEAPLNDALKAAIRQRLQQQADTPLNQFLQDSSKTLKVHVNPAYGSWDTQQLTVVPPGSPDPAKSGLPTSGGTTTLLPTGQGEPGATDQTGSPVPSGGGQGQPGPTDQTGNAVPSGGGQGQPGPTDQTGNPVSPGAGGQAPAVPSSTP